MERLIIVPDVHGRTFWRKVLENKTDKIIFLGDYTDPYEHEGITHADAIEQLQDIIQFKTDNMDRVILLLGNHDMFYIYRYFKCCRHTESLYELFHRLFIANFSLFQMAYFNNGYLFTHAGVTRHWANTHIDICDAEYQINQLFKDNPKVFFEVGYRRGGWSETGSPIWADINEYEKINPFPKIIQCFGHSQGNDIRVIDEDKRLICLDCRKVFVLENNCFEEL